jgi:uncharacterized membrane protein
MEEKTKYRLAAAILGLGILIALVGLNNIIKYQVSDGVQGVGFLFGGVVVALVSAVGSYYYRASSQRVPDQQDIAMKVLSDVQTSNSRTTRPDQTQKKP